MKAAAIITAAGVGKRMGSATPKQFLTIGGTPILIYTLGAFARAKGIGHVVITCEEARIAETNAMLAGQKYPFSVKVVAGGAQRQDSVRNGIDALPADTEVVAIHDAVRPFIEPETISQSLEMAKKHGACVVAVPVKDTIKEGGEKIAGTVDRSKLWIAQTPQTFRLDLLKKAFDKAYADNFYGTDDAMLVERLGVDVFFLKGSYMNIKITSPEDIKLANVILSSDCHPERSEGSHDAQGILHSVQNDNYYRIGSGFDSHKMVEGRKLIVGGVEIPFEKGLLGHSDADVLIHAVIDSLMGAAALGDIGRHFPDTDPKYKGVDSRELLRETAKLITKNGFEIQNIDANIIIERPKMSPHIETMRKNIAEDLTISIDKISVKAKSNEGLDAVGRGEAAVANSIALLKKF